MGSERRLQYTMSNDPESSQQGHSFIQPQLHSNSPQWSPINQLQQSSSSNINPQQLIGMEHQPQQHIYQCYPQRQDSFGDSHMGSFTTETPTFTDPPHQPTLDYKDCRSCITVRALNKQISLTSIQSLNSATNEIVQQRGTLTIHDPNEYSEPIVVEMNVESQGGDARLLRKLTVSIDDRLGIVSSSQGRGDQESSSRIPYKEVKNRATGSGEGRSFKIEATRDDLTIMLPCFEESEANIVGSGGGNEGHYKPLITVQLVPEENDLVSLQYTKQILSQSSPYMNTHVTPSLVPYHSHDPPTSQIMNPSANIMSNLNFDGSGYQNMQQIYHQPQHINQVQQYHQPQLTPSTPYYHNTGNIDNSNQFKYSNHSVTSINSFGSPTDGMSSLSPISPQFSSDTLGLSWSASASVSYSDDLAYKNVPGPENITPFPASAMFQLSQFQSLQIPSSQLKHHTFRHLFPLSTTHETYKILVPETPHIQTILNQVTNTIDPQLQTYKDSHLYYPKAHVPVEQYTGRRYAKENEFNSYVWMISLLNWEILGWNKGLLENAVNSWRNTVPGLMSRSAVVQANSTAGLKRRKKSTTAFKVFHGGGK
ncbi:hypothetical protein WICPIJ_003778 [Wickerhamomyces pijperi]|uniref:DUF8032 domain-containing protein n=1 Tax=Wickerhamomyces pijperi TaxID=599730 RepID=A0A9P8TNJ2_WICPI|nr:hypothetical protein WICPIJ_003778 [Wickerhamomyces pijperi]